MTHIFDRQTRFYWEVVAVKDKHGMTFTISDISKFDGDTFQELCNDVLKYISSKQTNIAEVEE